MDGDVIIGIVMVALWLLSSLAARVGRAMKGSEPEARPEAEGGEAGGSFQKALRDLAEQMGLDEAAAPAEPPVPELVVAGEHAVTDSEHRRTALETRRSPSEHEHTPGWHDRAASEVRRTASEAALSASEHLLTGSEHLRGDTPGAPIAALAAVRKRPRSELARRLHADLAGGPRSLARAVLLREILGPPVGLRSPQQGR